MSRLSKATKYISLLLAITVFTTNCLWAHKPEEQFWSERRKGIQQVSKPESTLLASLPRGMGPGNVLSATVFNRTAPGAERLPFEITQKWNQINLKTDWVRLLQTVSSQYATVRKICAPKKSNSNRIILHLQDVHLNDEAQINLARVVTNLSSHGAINLIGLEGAFEETSLELFQNFPYPEASKNAAEYLFKSQQISGPVWAALTIPKLDARIVGIDDRAAYAANVEAFKEGAVLRPKLLQAVSTLSNSIEKRIDAFHNGFFKKRVRSRHDYWDEKITLASYLQELSAGVDDVFPQVELFLSASDLEKSIDFQKVEGERTAFLEYASKKFSTPDMERLIRLGLALKSGDVSQAAFYEHFSRLADRAQLNLKSFPSFQKYIQYVLMADGIDPEKLFEDIRSLESYQLAREKFSESERAVLDADRWLHLSSKLADFSLTKDEWEEYEALKARVPETSDLSSFLVQPFEMFYRQAHLRDDLMAKNFLTQMDQKRSTAAILVTGGFHASGMEKSLLKAGVTVVHIAPRLTRIEGKSSLVALSVFSQEKTPLQKLVTGQKLFLAPAPMVLEEAALAYSGQAGLIGGPEAFQKSLAWFSTGIKLPTFISARKTAAGLIAWVSASGQRFKLLFRNKDGSMRLSTIVVSLALGSSILSSAWFVLTPYVNSPPVIYLFLIGGIGIATIFMLRRYRRPTSISKRSTTIAPKESVMSRRSFLRLSAAAAVGALLATPSMGRAQDANPANSGDKRQQRYGTTFGRAVAGEHNEMRDEARGDVGALLPISAADRPEDWEAVATEGRSRPVGNFSPAEWAELVSRDLSDNDLEGLNLGHEDYRASLAKAAGLRRMGNARGRLESAALAADQHPKVKVHALWALGLLPPLPGPGRVYSDLRFDTLRKIILHTPNTRETRLIRANAVRALGSLKNAQGEISSGVIEFLATVLHNADEDLYVLLAAVEAARRLNDPNLFEALLGTLEHGRGSGNVPNAFYLQRDGFWETEFPLPILWEQVGNALYAIRLSHPDNPDDNQDPINAALRRREGPWTLPGAEPKDKWLYKNLIHPLRNREPIFPRGSGLWGFGTAIFMAFGIGYGFQIVESLWESFTARHLWGSQRVVRALRKKKVVSVQGAANFDHLRTLLTQRGGTLLSDELRAMPEAGKAQFGRLMNWMVSLDNGKPKRKAGKQIQDAHALKALADFINATAETDPEGRKITDIFSTLLKQENIVDFKRFFHQLGAHPEKVKAANELEGVQKVVKRMLEDDMTRRAAAEAAAEDQELSHWQWFKNGIKDGLGRWGLFIILLVLNFAVMLMEVFMNDGSAFLLADGLHMAVHVFAGIVVIVVDLRNRNATAEKQKHNTERGLFLLRAALTVLILFMLYTMGLRLYYGFPVEPTPFNMAVAVLGLVINFVSLLIARRLPISNHMLTCLKLCIAADFFSSFEVISDMLAQKHFLVKFLEVAFMGWVASRIIAHTYFTDFGLHTHEGGHDDCNHADGQCTHGDSGHHHDNHHNPMDLWSPFTWVKLAVVYLGLAVLFAGHWAQLARNKETKPDVMVTRPVVTSPAPQTPTDILKPYAASASIPEMLRTNKRFRDAYRDVNAAEPKLKAQIKRYEASIEIDKASIAGNRNEIDKINVDLAKALVNEERLRRSGNAVSRQARDNARSEIEKLKKERKGYELKIPPIESNIKRTQEEMRAYKKTYEPMIAAARRKAVLTECLSDNEISWRVQAYLTFPEVSGDQDEAITDLLALVDPLEKRFLAATTRPEKDQLHVEATALQEALINVINRVVNKTSRPRPNVIAPIDKLLKERPNRTLAPYLRHVVNDRSGDKKIGKLLIVTNVILGGILSLAGLVIFVAFFPYQDVLSLFPGLVAGFVSAMALHELGHFLASWIATGIRPKFSGGRDPSGRLYIGSTSLLPMSRWEFRAGPMTSAFGLIAVLLGLGGIVPLPLTIAFSIPFIVVNGLALLMPGGDREGIWQSESSATLRSTRAESRSSRFGARLEVEGLSERINPSGHGFEPGSWALDTNAPAHVADFVTDAGTVGNQISSKQVSSLQAADVTLTYENSRLVVNVDPGALRRLTQSLADAGIVTDSNFNMGFFRVTARYANGTESFVGEIGLGSLLSQGGRAEFARPYGEPVSFLVSVHTVQGELLPPLIIAAPPPDPSNTVHADDAFIHYDGSFGGMDSPEINDVSHAGSPVENGASADVHDGGSRTNDISVLGGGLSGEGPGGQDEEREPVSERAPARGPNPIPEWVDPFEAELPGLLGKDSRGLDGTAPTSPLAPAGKRDESATVTPAGSFPTSQTNLKKDDPGNGAPRVPGPNGSWLPGRGGSPDLTPIVLPSSLFLLGVGVGSALRRPREKRPKPDGDPEEKAESGPQNVQALPVISTLPAEQANDSIANEDALALTALPIPEESEADTPLDASDETVVDPIVTPPVGKSPPPNPGPVRGSLSPIDLLPDLMRMDEADLTRPEETAVPVEPASTALAPIQSVASRVELPLDFLRSLIQGADRQTTLVPVTAYPAGLVPVTATQPEMNWVPLISGALASPNNSISVREGRRIQISRGGVTLYIELDDHYANRFHVQVTYTGPETDWDEVVVFSGAVTRIELLEAVNKAALALRGSTAALLPEHRQVPLLSAPLEFAPASLPVFAPARPEETAVPVEPASTAPPSPDAKMNYSFQGWGYGFTWLLLKTLTLELFFVSAILLFIGRFLLFTLVGFVKSFQPSFLVGWNGANFVWTRLSPINAAVYSKLESTLSAVFERIDNRSSSTRLSIQKREQRTRMNERNKKILLSTIQGGLLFWQAGVVVLSFLIVFSSTFIWLFLQSLVAALVPSASFTWKRIEPYFSPTNKWIDHWAKRVENEVKKSLKNAGQEKKTETKTSDSLLSAWPEVRSQKLSDLTSSFIGVDADLSSKGRVNVFEIRTVKAIDQVEEFAMKLNEEGAAGSIEGIVMVLMVDNAAIRKRIRLFRSRAAIRRHASLISIIDHSGNRAGLNRRFDLRQLLSEVFREKIWKDRFGSDLNNGSIHIRLYVCAELRPPDFPVHLLLVDETLEYAKDLGMRSRDDFEELLVTKRAA